LESWEEVFQDRIAGEEVGCYFWGVRLCDLGEKLSVLILEGERRIGISLVEIALRWGVCSYGGGFTFLYVPIIPVNPVERSCGSRQIERFDSSRQIKEGPLNRIQSRDHDSALASC